MATFYKFDCFVEDLAHKQHDLETDLIKYSLVPASNPPSASTWADVTDLPSFSYTNVADDGPGSRQINMSASEQTSGVYKLTADDITITASGGTIPDFRYIVIWNDTSTSDSLIGWYDYGNDLALSDTETLLIDFNDSGGMFTIT